MSTMRGKLFDRNRYAKRYPLVRAPKRMTYMGTSHLAIEMGTIDFQDADSGTLNYDVPFLDAEYQVVATLRDTSSADSDGGANVSIWVADADKAANSVTIHASAKFTGHVDVFAIKVG